MTLRPSERKMQIKVCVHSIIFIHPTIDFYDDCLHGFISAMDIFANNSSIDFIVIGKQVDTKSMSLDNTRKWLYVTNKQYRLLDGALRDIMVKLFGRNVVSIGN